MIEGINIKNKALSFLGSIVHLRAEKVANF